jgi:hypothetical protein
LDTSSIQYNMLKKLALLAFFHCCMCAAYTQVVFEKDPFAYASQLLKTGDYKAALMAIDYPAETKILMFKMTDAISKDTAWFLSYVSKGLKDSGGLKYNERMGLTEAEYRQMQKGMSEGKKYVQVGEETVTIINSDSVIQFKGTGTIAAIANLVINKKTRTVTFSQTVIPYKNEIHADDRTVVKAWDGHQFRFEEMNTTDLSKLNEIKSRSYRLLIGKAQKSQRNYLNLEATEINNGQKTVDIEIAFFF